MNNFNEAQSSVERLDNINSLLSPQAFSSTCLQLLLNHKGTPESDHFQPINDVPKPYAVVPVRPLDSSKKDTTTDGFVNISNSTEFPLNIINKSMYEQNSLIKFGTQAIRESFGENLGTQDNRGPAQESYDTNI